MENILLDWDDVNNADFCSWKGVYCGDTVTNSVISLNLSNLNLGGEISTAIGDLEDLQSIDLQGNKLTGPIPDEIGNCAFIEYLDLSDNLLYGDIPYSISKLKKLELLNLKNNQLTGPIPSTLTQLPNLKTLDIAQNQLTGEIPRLIYWNEVLQYLGLRGNFLSGSLSPDMCQLTGLWYLQAAWFSAVPWSMMAVVGYFAGVWSDHLIRRGMSVTFTQKLMQTIGFTGPGIALIALTMSRSPLVASAWLTLAVGLKSFSHFGFLVNLQEIAPQYSGVLHGLSNTAGTFAAIVGTVGAGYFVELVGSFKGFLILTSILYFAATLFWNLFSTGEMVDFDECNQVKQC